MKHRSCDHTTRFITESFKHLDFVFYQLNAVDNIAFRKVHDTSVIIWTFILLLVQYVKKSKWTTEMSQNNTENVYFYVALFW